MHRHDLTPLFETCYNRGGERDEGGGRREPYWSEKESKSPPGAGAIMTEEGERVSEKGRVIVSKHI